MVSSQVIHWSFLPIAQLTDSLEIGCPKRRFWAQISKNCWSVSNQKQQIMNQKTNFNQQKDCKENLHAIIQEFRHILTTYKQAEAKGFKRYRVYSQIDQLRNMMDEIDCQIDQLYEISTERIESA